jgi:ribulose-phosphate 3-epimerase
MSATVRVSASILAADFNRLGDDVKRIEDSGCDEIHFDVMDGHFVPNISFGPVVLEAVRAITELPIDVHMMVTEPVRYVREFASAGGDIFTVHSEACADLPATIAAARAAGMRPGISIKPATPVSGIAHLIGQVDRVLVMSVEPGFGGQSLMPQTLPKITELRDIAIGLSVELDVAVDGGVKVDNAPQVVAAGACTLISGTGLFKYKDGMAAAVAQIKRR